MDLVINEGELGEFPDFREWKQSNPHGYQELINKFGIERVLELELEEEKYNLGPSGLKDESLHKDSKGGPGSGHHGYGVDEHVWERAGRRARYKLVRTAVRHLTENPVLSENWHLPMVFQGKVAGILVGNDARAVTVLGPTMEPYPGSELVQFGR